MARDEGINAEWHNQVLGQISEHLHGADERERRDRRRDEDLLRVHQEGWKQIARAIDGGLRAIADAIRSR